MGLKNSTGGQTSVGAQTKLECCRELLGVEPPPPAEHDPDEDYLDRYLRLTGVSLADCPACKHGRMVCIETLLP